MEPPLIELTNGVVEIVNQLYPEWARTKTNITIAYFEYGSYMN